MLVGAPGCPLNYCFKSVHQGYARSGWGSLGSAGGFRCPSCGNPGSSLLPREAVASPEETAQVSPGGFRGSRLGPICNGGVSVGKLLNLSELLLPIWTKGIILLLFKGCQLQVGTCRGHWPSTSVRINSRAAAVADFQYPPKGAQDGEQK